MKNWNKYAAAVLALAMSLSLAGCGEKKSALHITVVNRTTYPIADVRIDLASAEDWSENRIRTTLQEGESAEIDLGEYANTELEDVGFVFRVYDENGAAIHPGAEESASILRNGDFLIFAPPDSGYFVYIDEGYDAAVYDQRIVESYGDDGKGDLIPSEDYPALVGGALPFTNMENLKAENYEDGTYFYADATEDGETIVINTVRASELGEQDLAKYLTACAVSLSEADSYELLSAEQNAAYTENLSYPVYVVTFTAGENEDKTQWTVFAADTDAYTYLYGFGASPEAAADMDEVYRSVFANLRIADGE